MQPDESPVEGDCAGPGSCLQVGLKVDTPRQVLARAMAFPGGGIVTLLGSAPWFALLIWTSGLTGAHVAGRRRPDGPPIRMRRILLPIALLSLAALPIAAGNYYAPTLPGWDYDAYLRLSLVEGMGLTVLVMVGALCWGLSAFPTGMVGLLALLLAAMALADPGIGDDRLACVLVSGYALLSCTLAAAGCLSAVRLLVAGRRAARHPEYLCWTGGVAVALVLLAERDAVQVTAMTDRYWLSPTTATYADLLGNLAAFPVDLASSAAYTFGLLTVLVLLRAMVETAAWDEGVGHPQARARLLALGGAVFFAAVDWDASLWTWPLSLWLILIPLVALTFRRFRSILDIPDRAGRSLRSAVLGHGLDALRADARRWRATVREGRSIDKRLGQGSIEIAAHRAEMTRIDEDAERSRGSILAHGVNGRLAGVTPIDVLLALGPYPSRLANARFATTVAALCGLPFLVVLTGLRWYYRGFQEGGSYLLSLVSDAGWMTVVVVGSSAVVGLLWQHLPGRRGPLRVLPLVGIYAVVPVLAYVVARLSGEEKDAVGLQSLAEVVCFLAVVTTVGLAMDLRALRDIRPAWQLRMQTLAFAYGTENLPAQLAFVSAQITAVVGLITFVKTGSPPPDSAAPGAGHAPPGR
jgi:hypothetical protein